MHHLLAIYCTSGLTRAHLTSKRANGRRAGAGASHERTCRRKAALRERLLKGEDEYSARCEDVKEGAAESSLGLLWSGAGGQGCVTQLLHKTTDFRVGRLCAKVGLGPGGTARDQFDGKVARAAETLRAEGAQAHRCNGSNPHERPLLSILLLLCREQTLAHVLTALVRDDP